MPDPYWLYEDGIGEARAALVASGRIVEALIEPDDGGLRIGAVLDARGLPRARPPLVVLAGGGEAVLANGGAHEGERLRVSVVREAIPERGRPKRAKVVPAPADTPLAPGPTLAERIAATGHPVRTLEAHAFDALEAAGWSELLEEAATGEIAFAGGALRMNVTPAMTLFDIDGDAEPLPLAVAGVRAVADAVRRFGIGGSIGIDIPTLADKAARHAVAAAFDDALPPPFERTAVNGFGFLQIVRPRPRASLPELLAADPTGAAARALLRRLEREPPPGLPAVRTSPAVAARLAAEPGWLAALARRTGRTTAIESA